MSLLRALPRLRELLTHTLLLQRPLTVTVEFQDASGAKQRLALDELQARIFLHEFDHLQGTLYVDRLPWRTILKARREIKEEGWARPGHSWLPGRDDFEGSGEDSEEA